MLNCIESILENEKYVQRKVSNSSFSKELDQNEENFILGCTYEMFSNNRAADTFKFNQKQYECLECSVEDICKYCYYSCHKSCTKNESIEVKNKLHIMLCTCGLKNHEKNDYFKKEDQKCMFKSADISRYNVENINFCLICNFICSENGIKYRHSFPNNHKKCFCIGKCHMSSNLFFIKKLEDINVFMKVRENMGENFKNLELPCQMINTLIESIDFTALIERVNLTAEQKVENDKYPTLVTLLSKISFTKDTSDDEEVQIKKISDPRIKKWAFLVFKLEFGRYFKFIYTSSKIIEIFQYEKLMETLKTKFERINEFEKKIIIKLGSIVWNSHIVPDFRLLKKISTYDYHKMGIKERSNLKKLFNSGGFDFIPQNVYAKYKGTESSLKVLICKEFIKSIFSVFYFKHVILNQFNYISKLLIFILIYIKLDLEEIENLIIYLYSEIKNHPEKIKHDYFSLPFAKILLLITINYNDLVFQNYLEGDSSKQFAHCRNETTKKLSKMVGLFKCFWDIYYHDFINDANLKILFYAENSYKNQIESMKQDESTSHYNLLFEYKLYTNKGLKLRELNSSSPSLLLNLNIRIDNLLIKYFKFEDENLNSKNIFKEIVKIIKEFPFQDISAKTNNEDIKGNSIKWLNSLKNDLKLPESYDLNGLVNYLIINSTDEILTFTMDMNQNIKHVNSYGEISFSNSDFDFLYYEESDFEFILNFLKLYLLTETGSRYFCLGRNMFRILNLFDKYPRNILNFFYILFKKVKDYKIDLKRHKVVIKIKDVLLNHLKKISKSEFDYEKVHDVLLILKIYNKLFHFWRDWDLRLDEIRLCLIEFLPYIRNSQILNMDDMEFCKVVRENMFYLVIDENLNTNLTSTKYSINDEGYKLIDDKDNFKIKLNKTYDKEPLPDIYIIYLFSFELFEIFCENLFHLYYLEKDGKSRSETAQINFNCSDFESAFNFIYSIIEKFKKLANLNLLSIRKRKILIRVLRTFYFIERIGRFSNQTNYSYFSDFDFFELFGNKQDIDRFTGSKYVPDNPQEKLSIYKEKLKIINFFSSELTSISNLYEDNKTTLYKYKDYLKELMFTLEYIIYKYLIYNEVYTRMTKIFNNLIRVFIDNSYDIIKLINLLENKQILTYNEEKCKNSIEILKQENIYSLDKSMLINLFLEHFQQISESLSGSDNFYVVIETTYNKNYPKRVIEDAKSDNTATKKVIKYNEQIDEILKIYQEDFLNKNSLAITEFEYDADFKDLGHTKSLVNYFVVSINDPLYLWSNKFFFITLLNRFLINQTDMTQKIIFEFSHKDYFPKIFEFVEENLQKNIFYSRNKFTNEKNLLLTLLTIESNRFIQLLSENLNQSFHPIIFDDKNGPSVFSYLFNNFFFIYEHIYTKMSNFNLCDERLIVLIDSFTQTINEYIQSCNDDYYKIILDMFLKKLFVDIYGITENKNFTYNVLNEDIICYSRIKFIEVWIELFKIQRIDMKGSLEKLVIEKFFNEIEEKFDFMLNLYQMTNERNFRIKLITLYRENDDFRSSYKLQLCLKIFQLIKILTDVYKIPSFVYYFKSIEKENTKIFEIIKFLEKIMIKVEVSYTNKNTNYYFIRPYKSFYLRKKTKFNFIQNVNRESSFSKLNDLISKTEYFTFEMIYNFNSTNSFSTKFFRSLKINYYFIEVINIIFIMINQILLILNFYHSSNSDLSIYNTINQSIFIKFNNNLTVTKIQTLFLFCVILIWFELEFLYLHNEYYMKHAKGKFKSDDNQNYNQKIFSLKKFFNKNFEYLDEVKILIDCIITNREINCLILSFILNIVYLMTDNIIPLVIQILFLANLTQTLIDILTTIKMRWDKGVIVLIFTYLVVYIFSWISILRFSTLFNFDSLDANKGDSQSESFCTSSLQCILFMIDYGVRSGGGIGDQLPMISYKNDTSFFFEKFAFDMFFHIIIILILGNIFLGIIVDAFGDLRDKTQKKEEDMKEICFICQMSQSDTIKNEINFNKHKNEDHNMWNYVYFLTDIQLTDVHDLDPIQRDVRKKLLAKDISWIPIYEDSEKADEFEKRIEFIINEKFKEIQSQPIEIEKKLKNIEEKLNKFELKPVETDKKLKVIDEKLVQIISHPNNGLENKLKIILDKKFDEIKLELENIKLAN